LNDEPDWLFRLPELEALRRFEEHRGSDADTGNRSGNRGTERVRAFLRLARAECEKHNAAERGAILRWSPLHDATSKPEIRIAGGLAHASQGRVAHRRIGTKADHL